MSDITQITCRIKGRAAPKHGTLYVGTDYPYGTTTVVVHDGERERATVMLDKSEADALLAHLLRNDPDLAEITLHMIRQEMEKAS